MACELCHNVQPPSGIEAQLGADHEVAIEVDVTLSSETVPQGGIGAGYDFRRQFPDVPFYFLPYAGLLFNSRYNQLSRT